MIDRPYDEVYISPGNTKLGEIPSVSLVPGVACGGTCACRNEICYAKRIYNRYKATKKTWDDNLTLAITNPFQYFASIHYQIPSLKTEYFRWHVGGDILNQDYLDSMIVIAKDYPKVKFLCFTKQYHLGFARAPRNLRIVFSAWPGYPLPRTSLPVAYMQDGTENRAPIGARVCSGSCHDCHDCWNMKSGDAVVFHKH